MKPMLSECQINHMKPILSDGQM